MPNQTQDIHITHMTHTSPSGDVTLSTAIVIIDECVGSFDDASLHLWNLATDAKEQYQSDLLEIRIQPWLTPPKWRITVRLKGATLTDEQSEFDSDEMAIASSKLGA